MAAQQRRSGRGEVVLLCTEEMQNRSTNKPPRIFGLHLRCTSASCKEKCDAPTVAHLISPKGGVAWRLRKCVNCSSVPPTLSTKMHSRNGKNDPYLCTFGASGSLANLFQRSSTPLPLHLWCIWKLRQSLGCTPGAPCKEMQQTMLIKKLENLEYEWERV